MGKRRIEKRKSTKKVSKLSKTAQLHTPRISRRRSVQIAQYKTKGRRRKSTKRR